MQEFDIAVIGAGPGGYVAAIYGARQGAKVALIEKDKEGGTCLNRGCIPTKALIRTTEVYKTMQEARRYACSAENIDFDYARMVSRKDRIVTGLVRGVQSLLTNNGVTTFKGLGQFVDAHTIKIQQTDSQTQIRAKHIIAATGSQPTELPIPGAEESFVMGSEEALAMTELPKSLAIIGAGVIGMEFASMFARLGVEVTLLEYLDDVLALLDRDLTQDVERNLRMAGVKLHTGSQVTAMEKTAEGGALIHFKNVASGEPMPSIEAEKVLMAVGRRPFLKGLGAQEIGIELQARSGAIAVNDLMQTNIRHIYAIGDVTGGMMLAHVASHQAIVAVNNIMGREHKMDYKAVPNAIFTDPEIASVGLSEQEAHDKEIPIRVGRFPFAGNGKALALGNSRGFVKLIAHKKTNVLLGGAVVGPGATDLISEITLAVRHGLTADDVTDTIHAHPTLPEAIMEAAWDVGSGALHLAD